MKKAFTLAEVLITMSVIGVIAVLTMPNLIENYQTKVMTTQLQKVYNQISKVVLDAMQDEAVDSYGRVTWYGDSTKTLGFLEQYFDVTNTCPPGEYKGCLADSYTSYNGANKYTPAEVISNAHMEKNTVCAVLKSGTTICNRGTNFIVDVNGPTNPNALGKDIFWFMVRDDGKMITSTNDPGRYLKTEPGYAGLAETFDAARVKYRAEANGDKCFGGEASLRFNGCLPYIMSNGWKMK